MKFRRERRPTLPMEPVWSFYPKYWFETVAKQYRWISLYLRLRMIYLPIKRDPKKHDYTDLALTPVEENETRRTNCSRPKRRRPMSARSDGCGTFGRA